MLEDFLDDFGDGDSFDFEFGTEDNAVTDDGFGHCFDIIGGDEVATGDSGIGATGEEEGLGGARASADEDGVVIAGGPDEIDDAILADDHLTDFCTCTGEDILDGLGICDHKEWRWSGFARERTGDGLVGGNGLALAWGLSLIALQNLFCLSEFGGAMDA